jgi:hypothetical protein
MDEKLAFRMMSKVDMVPLELELLEDYRVIGASDDLCLVS